MIDLWAMNRYIHEQTPRGMYHMQHILYAERYLNVLNERLGYGYDPMLLKTIGYGHDLLKDRFFDPTRQVEYEGHSIPQDLDAYIVQNMDVLKRHRLDPVWQSHIQFHPLAAGIFLEKECGITDPQILYPVYFHSLPIMTIYHDLDPSIQTLVDMMMLADKLSSNYLCINLLSKPVRVDLDLCVFGPDGNEFNYTLGLLIARLIAGGSRPDRQSRRTTAYYYERAYEMNPFLRSYLKTYTDQMLGGKEIWEPRKSPLWI